MIGNGRGAGLCGVGENQVFYFKGYDSVLYASTIDARQTRQVPIRTGHKTWPRVVHDGSGLLLGVSDKFNSADFEIIFVTADTLAVTVVDSVKCGGK